MFYAQSLVLSITMLACDCELMLLVCSKLHVEACVNNVNLLLL